jgi:hypothetical protein
VSRKCVGYFAGTDSTLLTHLICEGFDTLPISNGLDNHGRYIRRVTANNRLDLLIGYLHKIYAPEEAETQYQDIFHICRVFKMPLLLEVPRELHDKARALLGEMPEQVSFVDPSEILDAALAILRD